jgi:hypothetical protein
MQERVEERYLRRKGGKGTDIRTLRARVARHLQAQGQA